MKTKAVKRLYIVSFGDSRKYRVEFEDVDNVDNFHHTNPLNAVENEIKDYLDTEFPGEPLAYYTTPRVIEVNYADRGKYMTYPELDRVEIEKIKSSLKRELDVENADRRLNLNAPFDQIASRTA